MQCAGEYSSARIGEDGIKKCKTGVSPLRLQVLVLLFMVSMNQGILRRIMKKWKMIHLICFSPPLPPLDIQLLDKDTEFSNKTIFKEINMLTLFTLCLFVLVI